LTSAAVPSPGLGDDPLPSAATLLAHQPVGTLVVDTGTVVRYANPAASVLLDVPVERLVGQVFGLPLLNAGVTDVNVPGRGGSVRTLAMRVRELPGRDGYLVSLFDVSGRARRYEYEHRLVEALQRSLLIDRMPAVPGMRIAAHYRPGEGAIQVGGDWYDAIVLPSGRLGLAIGDVAGHGIESAALMSQLRNALRAYALAQDEPAAVVDRLDHMLHHFEPAGMATMIYLVHDPGAATLRFCAAGHPYPLLLAGDGTPEFLTSGRSLPLGTGIAQERECGEAAMPAGSTLVLYTDGLVERRTRLIDDGLAALAVSAQAAVVAAGDDAGAVCDAIVEEAFADAVPADDVAVLVLRTGVPV
jgi:serine phosphatase RsbU (regulator of sigma subunit)